MPYKNKEQNREYQRIWLAKRRAEYFKDKYCARCGSIENLEIDHIDRTKKISHNIWSWSEERRQRELAKCQVLCKKCHLEKGREYGDNPPAITHGNRKMYEMYGCRCSVCRAAHTMFQTNWRRNRS